MKNHILDYKKKLEEEICSLMDFPLSWDNAQRVSKLTKTWLRLDEMHQQLYSYTPYGESMYGNHKLTDQELMAWNDSMKNADGTTGGYWPVSATTEYMHKVMGEKEYVSPLLWNTAMNMMYSDYYHVAVKHGDNTPDYYADLAKAFLCDPDGPGAEAAMYAKYHAKN